MKNFFIAIQPEIETRKMFNDLVDFIKPMFSSQEINVNWTKQENFHVSILFVGRDINIIRKNFIKLSLNRLAFQPFNISIDKVKLGISSKYRELVYLSIDEGADDLREELLKIVKFVGVKRDQMFIPHITLGRVSKELTDEEYKNLSSQIDKFNKDNKIEINFEASKPVFLERDLNEYKVL